MRPHLVLSCVVLLSLCSACGGDDASSGGNGGAETEPFREQIDPAVEAKVAKRKLEARDKPLGVGETAPSIHAVTATKPAIVVFYRGHW